MSFLTFLKTFLSLSLHDATFQRDQKLTGKKVPLAMEAVMTMLTLLLQSLLTVLVFPILPFYTKRIQEEENQGSLPHLDGPWLESTQHLQLLKLNTQHSSKASALFLLLTVNIGVKLYLVKITRKNL